MACPTPDPRPRYVQSQLLLAALNITTHVLRPGGTFVAIQGFKKPKHPKAGVKSFNVLCKISGHAELDAMAAWAEQGKLKVTVQEQIPFSEIGRAYATNAAGHVIGKLAVVM